MEVMKPPQIKLTGEEYFVRIDRLLLRPDMSKYKWVFGVPRGGLPIAVHISCHTGIPLILDAKILMNTLEEEPGSVLVVDDICDSGVTLTGYKNSFPDHDTAVLFWRSTASFSPTYWGQLLTTDHWVVFPYEGDMDRAYEEYRQSMAWRHKR